MSAFYRGLDWKLTEEDETKLILLQKGMRTSTELQQLGDQRPSPSPYFINPGLWESSMKWVVHLHFLIYCMATSTPRLVCSILTAWGKVLYFPHCIKGILKSVTQVLEAERIQNGSSLPIYASMHNPLTRIGSISPKTTKCETSSSESPYFIVVYKYPSHLD